MINIEDRTSKLCLFPFSTQDISVGTVFKGLVGKAHRGVFLRTYEGVVSLDDPNQVWTGRYTRNEFPAVLDYREVSARLVLTNK